MLLAVAVRLAVPSSLMVAGLPPRAADAPLAGAVKETRPPATGSLALLAVTVTTSGAAKAVVAPVDWPLPEVRARVKPRDSKAPMSTAPTRPRPRWSVLLAPVAVPAPRAGLPGSRACVWVGPP